MHNHTQNRTCAHTHAEVHFVALSNKAHSCASLSHSFSAYHQLFFVQLRGCVVALLVGGYESILNAKRLIQYIGINLS